MKLSQDRERRYVCSELETNVLCVMHTFDWCVTVREWRERRGKETAAAEMSLTWECWTRNKGAPWCHTGYNADWKPPDKKRADEWWESSVSLCISIHLKTVCSLWDLSLTGKKGYSGKRKQLCFLKGIYPLFKQGSHIKIHISFSSEPCMLWVQILRTKSQRHAVENVSELNNSTLVRDQPKLVDNTTLRQHTSNKYSTCFINPARECVSFSVNHSNIHRNVKTDNAFR